MKRLLTVAMLCSGALITAALVFALEEPTIPAPGEIGLPTKDVITPLTQDEITKPAQAEPETPASGDTEPPAQDLTAPLAPNEITQPAQVEPPTPVSGEPEPPAQGEPQTLSAGETASPAQNSAAPPTQAGVAPPAIPVGDAERGRLVFGPCRTCHYAEESMGHNNGPNLHRIFGKVAGKQEGFNYYSDDFKSAEFVWTPELMYAWLENPMAMFPASSMMSLGVPDPQQRADLIEFLKQASEREP